MNLPPLLTRSALVVCLLAGGAALAAAQELPGAHSTAVPPPAGNPPRLSTTPQQPTIQIAANVDLVNMVFSVQDKRGAFVPGLQQGDFKVSENGRPQTIRYFSIENQLPLTIGLLLDTSPSQERVLGAEQQVSDAFFRQVVGKPDLAFVMGFDVDVTLLQDLTNNQNELSHAVDAAHIGGGGPSGIFNGSGGATHLWDAIYLACTQELAHQAGRKAIIVVTDGGEQGSRESDTAALRAALDSNTIVYAVIVADPRYAGMAEPVDKLAHIAEASGGRTIRPRDRDLHDAFDQIQNELRTQYTLAYKSDKPEHDGTFRAVKIEFNNSSTAGDKIRTRTGYYATPPDQQP